MTDFKTIDQVIVELDAITKDLAVLKDKEEEISQRYQNIEITIQNFERAASSKLSEISNYEQAIRQQSENITNLADKMDALVSQYQKQIDTLVERSTALSDNAEAFGKHMDEMRNISEKFGLMVEEAKIIETRLMMDRMELLIAKAEKLEPKAKKQAPKKESEKTE